MADETTEQRIAQIIAKQNEALQKQIEQEKTLRDLRGESLRRLSEEQAVLQTQIDAEEERLKNILKVKELDETARQARLEDLDAQILELENKKKAEGLDEDAIENLTKKIALAKEELKESKEILKLSDEELAKLEKIVRKRLELKELKKEASKANEELLEQTKDLLGSVTGISDQWKRGSTFTSAMLKSISANAQANNSIAESFKAIAEGMKETFSLQNIGASLIMAVTKATKDLMIEQSKSMAEFKTATGLNGEYARSLVDVQVELKHLGIATADVMKNTQALMEANTRFVFENKTTRDALADTASLMDAAYDSGLEFAGSLGVLTSTLNMSSAQANQVALDIAGAAKAMGAPPKEMLADFATLGPQLAAWGPNTKKVFLETAAAAKALNMQTSEMLDIAGQFDTFESAADRVGQLNAALGGDYFDTVEMVMATESERIEMIMDGIEATGRSFGDMGRFEKKRLAEAAGMTVDQLSKIANGNRDLYEELQRYQEDATMSYSDLSEAALENMNISERMEAIQKSLAMSLIPVLEALDSILKVIQKLMGWMGNWGGVIAMVAGGILFWKGTMLLASKAMTAMGVTAGGAAARVGTAMQTTATGASTAMTTIGTGFTTLASSITGGLSAIAPALASFGAAGLSAVPIVLALGAGLVAVGYAFKMIYEGIGGVIDSLSNLISNVADGVEKMYKLKDFNFASTALGIGGIAAAVGALSLALWFLDTDPLEDLAKMGTSIATAAPGLTATKETLVAASSMTPENVESMKQVSEQIIRLTTETAAAGNTAQLQVIREIIKENNQPVAGGTQTAQAPEVILEVDGIRLGKIIMPYVEKSLKVDTRVV